MLDIFGWFKDVTRRLDKCLGILTKILKILESKPKYKLKGGSIMYIVKDDNPDVGYAISFEVTDSEGIPVPVGDVNVAVVSSDETVVSLIEDENDPNVGTAHFGAPGNAGVTVTVSLQDGTIVGSFGAQFTVTTGDAAAISGGKITFSGLTEV
jgi:hypothetical protein